MIIGINAAAAVKQPRTGVEQYTYQLIKHLTMLPEARGHRFLLYLPSKALAKKGFDFPLPNNFEIKILCWPLPVLWTQIRLAWEMFFYKPEVLFIPAHILPFGAPLNSVVAIHGSEYEYFPQYYPILFRWYLCWSTKRAVKKAQRIIAVSESTRQDLIKFYGCRPEKIKVVHHGAQTQNSKLKTQNHNLKPKTKNLEIKKPYILYLGRVETKKNIHGILAAYKILKEKYGMPHQLVLAGGPGFGYEILRRALRACSGDIKETGYVSEVEKWQLLANADLFLFPSFYEGFGLPVLEAQAMGVPVITSYNSSLPEVAGDGAVFINPENPEQIAEATNKIFEDRQFRDKIVKAGHDNIKRFSWEKCVQETLRVIMTTKK
jgi:glycosyltransferase involved in cell wall biosynthesis